MIKGLIMEFLKDKFDSFSFYTGCFVGLLGPSFIYCFLVIIDFL